MADVRAGKPQAIGFLVGQVMKQTRGQANAAAASRRQAGPTPRRGGNLMGALNVILWIAGVVLIVVGFARARGPWSRYQALKEQDANVARYEAWRGGLRG